MAMKLKVDPDFPGVSGKTSLKDAVSGVISNGPNTRPVAVAGTVAGSTSYSPAAINVGRQMFPQGLENVTGQVPQVNPSVAQFPAPNPNPARNPQGYEYEAGMAGAGLTPEAAAENAAAKKDSIMGGPWPVDESTGEPVINFGKPVDTGFKTTDGNPVKSSYGSATDFYNQIAINNILDQTPSGAMTYEAYLSYNGITDPRKDYYRNLDAANEMYARAIGTYGASGEGLAQGNLANAGYSEYLTGLAYANRAQMYGQAAAQMRADNQTYGLRYAQYRQEYDEQQQLLAEQRAAYQAMQQAAAAQEAGISSPGGGSGTGVNIDIGGSGSGAQPSDRSAPSASPTLTSDAQKSAADYLNSNIKTASQLNAAVVALRGQGYSDADIQAAIDYWYAQTEADIQGPIDSKNYLSAGDAEALKQIFGEGDRYNAALSALQKKNDSLVKSVVDSINSGVFDSRDFQTIMAGVREQTAGTDKKGNTVYSWDSMKDEEKADMFMNTIRGMYESGDISQLTYQGAIDSLISNTIKNILATKTTFFNNGQTKLRKVIEALTYIELYPDSVSRDQKNKLLNSAGRALGSFKAIGFTSPSGMPTPRYELEYAGKKIDITPSVDVSTGTQTIKMMQRELTPLQSEALRDLLGSKGYDTSAFGYNQSGKGRHF